MSEELTTKITKEQFEWIRELLWKERKIRELKFDITWDLIDKDIMLCRLSNDSDDYSGLKFTILLYITRDEALLISEPIDHEKYIEILEYLAGFEGE